VKKCLWEAFFVFGLKKCFDINKGENCFCVYKSVLCFELFVNNYISRTESRRQNKNLHMFLFKMIMIHNLIKFYYLYKWSKTGQNIVIKM
jgi:hypothetical protein